MGEHPAMMAPRMVSTPDESAVLTVLRLASAAHCTAASCVIQKQAGPVNFATADGAANGEQSTPQP